MSNAWQQEVQRRLLASQHGGGWGYHARTTICAEPTALASMALSSLPAARASAEKGLHCLVKMQRSDGGVKISDDVSTPCWPTGLAIAAWLHPPTIGATEHSRNIERAVAWLCRTEGLPIPPRPEIHGHDTTLTGWPWVDRTHSWIEPTAYATWALRLAGLAKHTRTQQGVEVLLDRVIPGGGWNYGNPEVLGQQLRPFPGTTGLVLVAMNGEPRSEPIEASIQYLLSELRRVRAPITLSWGLMGLSAWHETPREAPEWLSECAERIADDEPSPLHDALLLLADAGVNAQSVATRGSLGG